MARFGRLAIGVAAVGRGKRPAVRTSAAFAYTFPSAMSRSILALFLVVTTVAGCMMPPNKELRQAELLGRQLQTQDAELVGQKFRTLLDFEHPQDAVFVALSISGTAAGHTGKFGVIANERATVNVSSLLYGAPLPGDWTLAGGYVRSTGGRIAAVLLADGREIARTTRQAPVNADLFTAVDLTSDACRQTLPTAKKIELRFEAERGFVLDDVLLVDNRRTLADTTAEPRLGWTVRVRGLSLAIAAPSFQTAIPLLAGDPDAWSIQEANAVRVRLRDAHGDEWTILPDGRSVRAGRTTTMAGAAVVSAPADVTVDESTGRLDRETPGDADNDGYNERRAAYQLVATGPRLKLRLAPRRRPADVPVIEVRGLPNEANVVTVDGRLINQTARLADGTLVVLVPMTISEPVDLTIGVTAD